MSFLEEIDKYLKELDPKESLIDAALYRKHIDRQGLSRKDAESVIRQMVSDQCPEIKVAATLRCFSPEVLTADELCGFATGLRALARPISLELKEGDFVVDTCGTGGDSLGIFNVSTAVAFVAAAAGLKVAKHGNRSITSKTGSADVLEALGAKIDQPPELAIRCINEVGIGFMFAPSYHKATARVQPIRQRLANGLPAPSNKTMFNVLGPLSNPLKPQIQVIGVYNPGLLDSIAGAFNLLGGKRAMVVAGFVEEIGSWMDEFSIGGASHYSEVCAGSIKHGIINAACMGVEPSGLKELKGGDSRENAKIIKALLSGKLKGPKVEITAFNSAVMFYISGVSPSIESGFEKAKSLISNGKPYKILQDFIKLSNS